MTSPGSPLVSIVTPSLNQGRFLGETIESVLSQDYAPIEHLVVDGGSTDDTMGVLKRYGARVRWISEPDLGQADAVNKGWRSARGEILGWLNSDDTLEPGAVAAAVRALLEDPTTDAVYSDCREVAADGASIRELRCRGFDLRDLLLLQMDLNQPTVFLRRRFIESVGDLDVGLHMAMDYDLWVRGGLEGEALSVRAGRLGRHALQAAAKTSVRAWELLADHLVTFDKVFASPSCPLAIQSLKRRIYGHAYMRGGERSLAAGRWREGRARLIEALARYPNIREPWVVKAILLYVDSLFGSVIGRVLTKPGRVRRVAERLRAL